MKPIQLGMGEVFESVLGPGSVCRSSWGRRGQIFRRRAGLGCQRVSSTTDWWGGDEWFDRRVGGEEDG